MTVSNDSNEAMSMSNSGSSCDDGITTPPNTDATDKVAADDDIPAGSSSLEVSCPFPPFNNSTENETDEDDARGPGPPNFIPPRATTKRSHCLPNLKRFFRYFVSHWPRTIAILEKMLLLSLLICWAFALGYVLSNMEGPNEIASNDAVARDSFLLATLPFNETRSAMTMLPTTCLNNFFETHSKSGVDVLFGSTNATFDFGSSNDTFDLLPGESNTSISVEEFLAAYFPNYSLPDVEVKDPPSVADLYLYMKGCEVTASQLLDTLVHFSKLVVEASVAESDDLTFNWIRCWNASNPELGKDRNPWVPNQAQINASANQASYFRDEWIRDQQSLELQYLHDWNCTGNKTNETMCLLDAREASVQAATGGGGCSDNTGSSAWFWFTVMTTVGYGNQSPVTKAGRALVSGLGWLSIMTFGAITVLTSYVWTAIMDDFLRRTHLEYLSRPSIGAMLWGIASIGWIALIADSARDWWNTQIPGFEFTKADSYWFAYISSLTVGLGDYYLQPQGFYLKDVFHWASRMLTGFVVVSLFLGKASELVTLWFPPKSETFAEYLARTDLWGNSIDVKPSKSLKTLEALIDEEKHLGQSVVGDEGNGTALEADGKAINYHRIHSLAKKKYTLVHMLDDCQSELDQRMARYESDGNGLTQDAKFGLKFSVANLRYEENVLEVVLQRTKEARMRMESSSMESGVGISR